MAEQIKIQTFNWGPCVIKLKIKPEYGKQLLDEAKKNKEDFRGKLAGQLDMETAYSEEAQAKMLPWLSAYFGCMISVLPSQSLDLLPIVFL